MIYIALTRALETKIVFFFLGSGVLMHFKFCPGARVHELSPCEFECISVYEMLLSESRWVSQFFDQGKEPRAIHKGFHIRLSH